MVTKKGLKPVTVHDLQQLRRGLPGAESRPVGRGDLASTPRRCSCRQRGDFTRAIAGVFPQTACFAFANKPLADAVVGALNELKKDGFYDKLLDQYGVLKIEEPDLRDQRPGPGMSLLVVLERQRRTVMGIPSGDAARAVRHDDLSFAVRSG